MEDNLIVDLYLKRDETAIKETDTKYGKYCKTIANNITCNFHDAEECVNDTYLKTWNTIPPKVPNWFKAYIGKIARNFAINRYREKNCLKRGNGEIEIAIDELEECISDIKNIDQKLECQEIINIINNFLETSDLEQRKIFVRRYWYTESIENIAERFSISESKVKSILFRMRKKLKEKLIEKDIYI